MEIIATLQQCTPIEHGVSKSGASWKKTNIVAIVNEGDRQSIVAFQAFGDRADTAVAISPGATVRIRFRLDSQEFTDRNGNRRWSTEATCYSIAPMVAQYPQQAQVPANNNLPAPPQYQQTPPPQYQAQPIYPQTPGFNNQ
jgi:single-stranded DNA-binding protein